MQDEGGREDTNPPPQYASSAEAEALIKDINNVQEMAVSFAGHLIAERLSDSCSGNIATARVPIRSQRQWRQGAALAYDDAAAAATE
jgi:hypothetical protein